MEEGGEEGRAGERGLEEGEGEVGRRKREGFFVSVDK